MAEEQSPWETAHERYSSATANVTSQVRQLALAAIAISWVFRESTEDGSIAISDALVRVVVCAVVALALDFAQFVWKSIAWGIMARRIETNTAKTDREHGDYPVWINYGPNILFWGKTAALAICYLLLAIELLQRLK